MSDMNTANIDSPSIGYLKVQAFTADEALPLQGADVLVTREDENGNSVLIKVLTTDQDGATELLGLEAPDVSLSQKPGLGIPYSQYNVTVTLPGYYPKIFERVPIFAGQVAIQNVAMMPATEGILPLEEEPIVELEPIDLQ